MIDEHLLLSAGGTAQRGSGCVSHPHRTLGKTHNKDPSPERSKGLWTALDSDAALNAAGAPRGNDFVCAPRGAGSHPHRPQLGRKAHTG